MKIIGFSDIRDETYIYKFESAENNFDSNSSTDVMIL